MIDTGALLLYFYAVIEWSIKMRYLPCKVVKKAVNLGDLPYFQKMNNQILRVIRYHQSNIIEKFPRVLSFTRINDALEINLFLEHRFLGLFMPPKRGGRANPLGV